MIAQSILKKIQNDGDLVGGAGVDFLFLAINPVAFGEFSNPARF
jgi:hypothetical protein